MEKNTKNSKQLKKVQALIEPAIKQGDRIMAYWTYSDYLENQKHFSAVTHVTEIMRDSILVSTEEEIKDVHGIILYPKNWKIYIPKTNNPTWGINNRFEKK